MCRLQQQHTSRQLTATPACTISQRSATVSESDQTGFTSRRQTVQILWHLNSWSGKCINHVQSIVRVQSISPRPPFNNFSRATVPLNGPWAHCCGSGLGGPFYIPWTRNQCRMRSRGRTEQKWATVSESLRSLKTNERPWAICSGRSEEMSDVSESLILLTKNEQMSNSLKKIWPKKSEILFYDVSFKVYKKNV